MNYEAVIYGVELPRSYAMTMLMEAESKLYSVNYRLW